MTERDEQIEVIDEELARLEKRINELREAKARIRAERAEFALCEFCGRGIHPGAKLCWSCAKEHYS